MLKKMCRELTSDPEANAPPLAGIMLVALMLIGAGFIDWRVPVLVFGVLSGMSCIGYGLYIASRRLLVAAKEWCE